MLSIPASVEAALDRFEMKRLVTGDYRLLGVAVLRSALPVPVVETWQRSWREFQDSRGDRERIVDPFNPIVVKEDIPPDLATIYRTPDLLDIAQQIYPDLGIFGQRFLVKDRQSRGPVFLHQDFGYDTGWPDKTSIFVALSPMSPESGGLYFLPGTHHAGYLGDAGEIDREALAPDWPVVAPSLLPGDIALMHECTWHGSYAHVTGPDRAVIQIQYQPASDPSNSEVLRGRSVQLVRMAGQERVFKRSRSSRIRELQAVIDRKQSEGI